MAEFTKNAASFNLARWLAYHGKNIKSFIIFFFITFLFAKSVLAQDPCNAHRWASGDGWRLENGTWQPATLNGQATSLGIVRCASSAETESGLQAYAHTYTGSFPIGNNTNCFNQNTEVRGSNVTGPIANQTDIVWFNFDIRPLAGTYQFQIVTNQTVGWALFYSNNPAPGTTTSGTVYPPSASGQGSLSGNCQNLTYADCGISGNGWSTITVPSFTQPTNYYLAMWPLDGGTFNNSTNLIYKSRYGCGGSTCSLEKFGSDVLNCNNNGTYTVCATYYGSEGKWAIDTHGATSYTVTTYDQFGAQVTMENNPTYLELGTINGTFPQNDIKAVICATYNIGTNYNVTLTPAGAPSDAPNNYVACTSSGSFSGNSLTTPTVTTGSYGPTCDNAADIPLVNGSPAGGVWSGTGVSGSQQAGFVFDPSVGTQTLTYTYTAGNSCAGSAQVTITVNNSTSHTTTATACDSYTWAAPLGNGNTYTASTVVTNTTTNAAGCPHTETLNLTINHSTAHTTTATACDSYTWAAPLGNGNTYTASTVVTNTTTNAAGCPHTETLSLTISNSTTHTTVASACDSYTWAAPLGNGNTYTASTVVTNTTTNAAGCTHTETLNLTITHSTSHTTVASACDSYTWAAPLGNGNTYTASTVVTNTTTNAAGCTHTETLNLTITHSTSHTTTATACDSYTWVAPLGNGNTYTASTVVTNTTTNAAGCTHTETLSLTINNSTAHTTVATACDSYTWAAPLGNGQTYTASGTFTNTTTNAAGCPHTETLSLTIKSCIITYCSYTQGFWSNKNGLALLSGLLTEPLIIGDVQYKSLTFNAANAEALSNALPAGGKPAVLTGGTFSSYLDKQGHINNVLLGQTITLALNTRLNSTLGGFKIQSGYITTSDGCRSLPSSVVNYLTSNGTKTATVQNLLNLANDVLSGKLTAGVGGVPSLSDINSAVTAINEVFDECKNFTGYQTSCPASITSSRVTEVRNAVTLSSKLSVNAYPNPFINQVRFVIQSPISGQGTLDAYNALGQKVKTLYQGNITAGTTKTIDFTVPSTFKSNLIYIFRIGNKQVSGKIMKF